MFLINSRQGLVTAALVKGRPFFRSYGASLPSSLERVLSRPLVFSTNLPVSVSGTGVFIVVKLIASYQKETQAFLGSMTSLATLICIRIGITS